MARKVKLKLSMKQDKKKTTVAGDLKEITTDDLITFLMALEDLVKSRVLFDNMNELTKEILEGK